MGMSNNFWTALRASLVGALGVKTADAQRVEGELRAVDAAVHGTDFTAMNEEATRAKQVGNIVYPEPVQRYTLGSKVWADDGDPLAQAANRAMEDWARGVRRVGDQDEEFDVESLENAISHVKVLCAKLEAVQAKLNTGDAMHARALGKKTSDARSRPTAGQPIQAGAGLLSGVRPVMFDASRTRDYAQSLKKRRAAEAGRA